MKYLLLDEKNVIIHISDTEITRTENGNWIVNNGSLQYGEQCAARSTAGVEVIDGVIPQKYIYDGGQFVLNPDYVEPEDMGA